MIGGAAFRQCLTVLQLCCEYRMKKLVILLICLVILLPGNNLDIRIAAAAAGIAPMTTAMKQTRILTPAAPINRVHKGNGAEIDYSNIADGYVKVRYFIQTSRALRVLIATPGDIVYIYQLNRNMEYERFPLSEGNGIYTISVYKQPEKQSGSNLYSHILSFSVDVRLVNEHAPFLSSNKLVNFNKESLFMNKVEELKKLNDNRAAIDEINRFIVKNMKYDDREVVLEDGGYVPCLDRVYTELTGRCIDYAALMVAMARSLGIPAKLVTGYTREQCHAWVEVYLEPSGWERRDPTIEALSRVKRNTQQLINDDKNYKQMFQY